MQTICLLRRYARDITVVASLTAVANQSVRVNVDLLESLMTMVSELVASFVGKGGPHQSGFTISLPTPACAVWSGVWS